MESATSTQVEQSSSTRSFRMSCDRCYTQKLKCSISGASNTCQRCAKARVPCAFSRRAPAKRGRPSKKCKSPPSPSTSLTAAQGPNLPPPATPASPRPSVSGAAMASSKPQSLASSSTTQEMSVGDSGGSELASSCTPSTGILPHFDLQPFDPYPSETHNHLMGYDWLHGSLDLCDTGYVSEAYDSELAPFLQSAALMTVADQVPDSTMQGIPGNEGSKHVAVNTSLTSRNLTSLIADMQQQSAELIEGHWHKDDACGLGDYPIGRIIELSQRFSAVSGPILRRASSSGEESTGSDMEEGTCAQDDSTATADAPTMLLVMCGYLWLLRIYKVVLNHFQKHLHRMSPSQYTQAASAGFTTNRTADGNNSSWLCLDELPCADDTLGLQRIHMAIRLLLDLLNEVESHLGPRGSVARDVTMTLLVNSGSCPTDGPRDFEKDVATVKMLLLQKMGL